MTFEQAQRLIAIFFCVAATAFFASFVLTFGSGRRHFTTAAIFYSIGILFSTSLSAYFRFFRGSAWPFARFPTLGWLMPILLFCFGIAAVALLWPSIPQKTATRLAMFLFVVVCPILILIRMLPDILQLHHRMSFDLTWLVYAVLWFRIRDGYAGTAKTSPDNSSQTS
jgi:hypothetical protein